MSRDFGFDVTVKSILLQSKKEEAIAEGKKRVHTQSDGEKRVDKIDILLESDFLLSSHALAIHTDSQSLPIDFDNQLLNQ